MFNKAMPKLMLALGLTLIFGCSGGKMEDKKQYTAIKDIPEATWKKLAEKRIYFGHQSVGSNILAGVTDVMNANPKIKLKIMDTKSPEDFNGPVFGHSGIGKNVDPRSKCQDFTELMEKGIGKKVDIAFMKFCYVDVIPSTDVDQLFQEYKKMASALKTQYPNITFIHTTVPLTALQTGMKAWVKQIIGKPLAGYDDNARRSQFNEMLRKEYEGKAPIFDLAGIESTYPDGTKATVTKHGKTFYHLVPEYTDDGGHLNQKGRRIAAEHLLILLANL